MKQLFRDPQIEEGQSNIILQNRCGNRMTMLFHEDRTELEFVYKPNAFRRKDFRARNFSNRDNFTTLFRSVAWPEISAGVVREYHYDPFVTRIHVVHEQGGQNTITCVNLPDENCFALAARQPLVLTFQPHGAFSVRDGLLWEGFEDRGETIVSFVAFPGMEASRYRVLDDGRHVLQLLDHDVVLVGGEQSVPLTERTVARLRDSTVEDLIAHTERTIATPLSHGRLLLHDDADYQYVLDINRRLNWSGLDAGGACFGAMNRIYHLIWVRDGSMAASMMARAGMADMIRIWAPFLLANPSEFRDEKGELVREFSQLVGTRWSKTEDDGIYYAMLSLYALVQCAGEMTPLEDGTLRELLDILQHTIESRFDTELGLFGSDVLGEDPLGDSPYHGYDVVSGRIKTSTHTHDAAKDTPLRYCYSLYQNINMYNCLRMAQVLIDLSPVHSLAEKATEYDRLAEGIAQSLSEKFVNEKGQYRALLVVCEDGQKQWRDFGLACDCWEYAWAVSTGPFLPDPAVALHSSAMVLETWPTVKKHGYCPWNFLLRFCKDTGAIDTEKYRLLMNQQISEAMVEAKKYPTKGLLSEYQGMTDHWRGLPFGTGSLVLASCSLLAQPLAMGLAVRASNLLDRVNAFCYRTSRIDFTASGGGDVVQEVRVNGQSLRGTLQIPESMLCMGKNTVEVTRGTSFEALRLHGSNARLDAVHVQEGGEIVLQMYCPFAPQLIFENCHDPENVTIEDQAGQILSTRTNDLSETKLTVFEVEGRGQFRVRLG